MRKEIGVLVFPAGEINSVELRDALSACVNIRLYGASSVDRHGEYVFRNYISGLPHVSEPDFIECFNKIINENQIDVIFPTHDDVAEYLAFNREILDAKVITADKEASSICRDKAETFRLFQNECFCPKIYNEAMEFPVFVKPRKGQGSVGTRKLYAFEPVNLEEYVICEYLPGEEYTVDCLTDKNGSLKAILPRSRRRVFGGVSVAGRNELLTPEIEHIAQVINSKLNFLGLWYFQIKRDDKGTFKLLEISTRCAGTMCLARAMGVNLPLLSVYAVMGYEIEAVANQYSVCMDRTFISRYKIDYEYDTVYIDYDDTIIINGSVHLPAIWFLYQCRRDGKWVVLLTRHNTNYDDTVEDSLQQFSISPGLFREIVTLSVPEHKYDYIKSERAIFIDNAYAERRDVREKCGIPVFDVDGIEVLLDWRN